jgi:SagB-type dehydrogenase family enzyme
MPEPDPPDLWELRPLATALPRRDDGGVVFAVEDRDVRVEGDAATVEGLVSLCDGHRTLSEIAAVLEGADRDELHALARALVEHGALVDCTEAYRVFHWQSSIESDYFRAPDEAAPAPPGAEPFRPARLEGLPVALAPVRTEVRAVAARRVSAVPRRDHRAASFAELSAVLEGMYAVEPGARRPVPSGGALYSLAVHVVARTTLDALRPGLWWYDPADAALRLVRDRGLGVEEILLRDDLSDALLEAGGPIVFVSANLERTSRVYANRGYRWALIEVGAVMQNAYLVAAELGLPVRAIGGFRDVATHEFLELPRHVWPMLALLLGA